MEDSDLHTGVRLRLRPFRYEDDREYEIRKEDFQQISSSYGSGVTYRAPHWYYCQVAMMLQVGDKKYARKAVERDSGLSFSSLHLCRIVLERDARKL